MTLTSRLIMKKALLSVCLLVASAAAQAETAYAGLGYGMTSFKMGCASLQPCDKGDSGMKAYAGVKVTPQLALEAGYLNFGKGRAGEGASRVEYKASAFVVNGAFRHDFMPELSGVLRLGLSTAKVESSRRAANTKLSENAIKPYWGIGLEYQFSKNLKAAIAADFVRGDLNDEGIKGEMYSISAQMGF